MIFTPNQIEQAFGMTGITLVDQVIVSGSGLDLETANARLQMCIAKGTLTPEAESYQVRAWLIRNGLDLATIPQMIEALTPPGPVRVESLIRWEYAVRVPHDHPLVIAVATQLNLNLKTVWFDILAL
jgi:hypothetical protein